MPGVPLAQSIVSEVEKFTGYPYVYGDTGPTAFDCSGLVQYVLTQVGVHDVPRTSEEQWAWAKHIDRSQLQPGDLVFAQFPGDNAAPGHVGIYTGGGNVLSAEDPAQGVGYATLADWGSAIVGYGRVTGVTQGSGGSGGGGGGGGGGTTNPAVLTSFWGDTGNLLVPPENALQNAIRDAWTAITSPASDAVTIGTALTQITRVFTALAGIGDKLFESLEWLFVPNHWVRMLCFGAGVLFFIPALFSLLHTGSGGNYGDVTLALGILLLTVSGVLFFIAFHNLPTGVKNLQELLTWVSDSIRQGKAASSEQSAG